MNPEIGFTVNDFEIARNEFDNVINILNDNQDELNNILDVLNEYDGYAVQSLTNKLQEFQDMHILFCEEMDKSQTEISQIKESAISHLKPTTHSGKVVLKVATTKKALEDIIDVLKIDLNRSSLQPSQNFKSWIDRKDKELNDGIIEGALNPKDEWDQRQAEDIYRDNKKTFDRAYKNFIDDITFHDEIYCLERSLKQVNLINKDIFPHIASGSLYNNLFAKSYGVQYHSITKILNYYAIDTNGIMPDSIFWQLFDIGLIVATICFGGEIVSAGVVTIDIISDLTLAGYVWLSTAATSVSIWVTTQMDALYNLVIEADVWWQSTVMPWIGNKNVGNYLLNEWIKKDLNDTNKYLVASDQLLQGTLEEIIISGDPKLLTRNIILMSYGVAKVFDTIRGIPSTIKELEDDLANGDGFEAITDFLIESLSPTPFTGIDDNFFDILEDFVGDK